MLIDLLKEYPELTNKVADSISDHELLLLFRYQPELVTRLEKLDSAKIVQLIKLKDAPVFSGIFEYLPENFLTQEDLNFIAREDTDLFHFLPASVQNEEAVREMINYHTDELMLHAIRIKMPKQFWIDILSKYKSKSNSRGIAYTMIYNKEDYPDIYRELLKRNENLLDYYLKHDVNLG